MARRGSKQFYYDLQRQAWADAVQYRRDKQTELARAVANEHEAARRTIEAAEAMLKK
jgi:hypothetical protein